MTNHNTPTGDNTPRDDHHEHDNQKQHERQQEQVEPQRIDQHEDARQQVDEQQHAHEDDHQPRPQIWIASLADYVNGRLHGAWIDATQTPDELEAATRAILASSPEKGAEEWAIHDYDGFGALRLGEYESFDAISTIARGITEHGLAFAAWIDHLRDTGETITETLIDDFTDHYLGHHNTPADWAQELCDDLGYTHILDQHLPATIASYLTIDHSMLARDMEIVGEITSVEADGGGVWIFRA